jgi:hypothetical protein
MDEQFQFSSIATATYGCVGCVVSAAFCNILYSRKENHLASTASLPVHCLTAQTTIMAATYGEGLTGGVVLGADTRTSSGNYIANRATDKITQLTDKVSNSAAFYQGLTHPNASRVWPCIYGSRACGYRFPQDPRAAHRLNFISPPEFYFTA